MVLCYSIEDNSTGQIDVYITDLVSTLVETQISQQCSERTDGAEELAHIVPGGFGPHRVFSSKSNTAHSNDQQDAHLKVPQGHDIVTQPAKSTHAPTQTHTHRFKHRISEMKTS